MINRPKSLLLPRKAANSITMKTRVKRLILSILVFLFLVSILFYFIPLAHRIYSTKTLDKYEKLQTGMDRNEVIRLLGQPLNVQTMNSADLELNSSSWDFTKETIDDLKSKNIPLERYLYEIRFLPSLSRNMKPHIGVEVYINKNDGRVILIHRLH